MMQARGESHPTPTSAPMPVDTDQKAQRPQLRRGSISPGTPPTVVPALRHSPANTSMPGRPSRTTTPNTNANHSSTTDTTASTTGTTPTPGTTPTHPHKQRRPSHMDVMAHDRSPTNPLASTGAGCGPAVPRSRPTPTLSAERLGEPAMYITGQPPLLDGAPPHGMRMGGPTINYVSPMSGVLDTPSTPPSAFPVSAGTGLMPMDHTGIAAPVTPTEHSSTNLILYNVGPNMSEVELKRLFEPYGPVASCAVMRDIHTGVGLGTAFVKFSAHADAARALEAFSDRANPVYVFETKPLVVQWARKQHDGTPSGEARKKIMKLFVRNIPLDCTTDDLEALFSRYGTVRQVTLHRDTAPVQDEALVRLIAFVIYAEEGCAERAAGAVHNTKPFTSCNGIPIMIKLAESSQRRRFTRNGESGPAPGMLQSGMHAPFGMPHTSPMMPGMGMANFDVAAVGIPHLQRPGYGGPQQMPYGDQSFDQPSGSCYSNPVPSFDGSGGAAAAYAPSAPAPLVNDGRDVSIPSFHGTPATATPLAPHGAGNSPALPRGGAAPAVAAHAWDRDNRVSPMSSSATVPVMGAAAASCGPLSTSAFTQQASLSFDASAAGHAYGGGSSGRAVSASSPSNGASYHEGSSAGPAGSFLYANVPSPQMGGRGSGAAWYGNASGVVPSGSFGSSSQLPGRVGADACRSPPAAMHVYTSAALAPTSGRRPPATGSTQGSPQQPGSLGRSPCTSVPTSPSAVHHSTSNRVTPPAANGQAALLAKVLVPSESGTPDLSNTLGSNGTGTPNSAPVHHTESPTALRVDASESWRRAVRSHVHQTKRLVDPSSVNGSQLSSSSMSMSGHHAAPQSATSPLTASGGPAPGRSLSAGNDPTVPGATPPTSPASNSALSTSDVAAAGGANGAAVTSGRMVSSNGAPSSGRTRYYNNPYCAESAKLFC